MHCALLGDRIMLHGFVNRSRRAGRFVEIKIYFANALRHAPLKYGKVKCENGENVENDLNAVEFRLPLEHQPARLLGPLSILLT